MSGMESVFVPVIGSVLGGLFGGGQDSSPSMDYSQPPPGQIDPMFQPGMQDLVNIWRNQLFTNPALNKIMTGGGYLGSLFDPSSNTASGTGLSLFGKPVVYPTAPVGPGRTQLPQGQTNWELPNGGAFNPSNPHIPGQILGQQQRR